MAVPAHPCAHCINTSLYVNANKANKRECFVCSPSAHYTIIKLYMDGLILCLHKMHRSNYLRVLAFICVVRVFFCF